MNQDTKHAIKYLQQGKDHTTRAATVYALLRHCGMPGQSAYNYARMFDSVSEVVSLDELYDATNVTEKSFNAAERAIVIAWNRYLESQDKREKTHDWRNWDWTLAE